MQREYFCVNCGLYYWEEYPSKNECPNKECNSKESEDGQMRYACDTTAFAYFAEAHGKEMKKYSWSSEKFAPKEVVDYYKKSGLEIRK